MDEVDADAIHTARGGNAEAKAGRGTTGASPRGQEARRTVTRITASAHELVEVPEYTLDASPVATSFPALVPFLSFRDLDADWEEGRREFFTEAKKRLEVRLSCFHYLSCTTDTKF